MAIFSRRTIQRLIDENAGFLSRRQIREHVKRLNAQNDPGTDRQSEPVLDAEWEVVLLNAFSKLGRVEHEPTEGRTRPDMHFTPMADPRQSLIADVVTVSDRGKDEIFPVKALFAEVLEVAAKHNLRANSFAIDIKHRDENGEDSDRYPVPKLPGRSRLGRQFWMGGFSNSLERSPRPEMNLGAT